MSLINTEIKPFRSTAFRNGDFVDISDADLRGGWSVVFFYPADFTFVCPTELGDLADNYAAFKALGVEIYSVSTDTHFTHKAWHDTSDTIAKIEFVWKISDIFNGLMAFPNLVGIIGLSGVVWGLSRDYFSRKHVPYGKVKLW